jgi:dolichol-phosphate mannosyltransferase
MPGRLFGFTGSIMAVIGLIITVSLITEKILFAATLADRPLFTLSIFMLILGVIMMMLGTLGELLMRIYFESTGRKPYMIRNTVNL